jgi:hypothetical protein
VGGRGVARGIDVETHHLALRMGTVNANRDRLPGSLMATMNPMTTRLNRLFGDSISSFSAAACPPTGSEAFQAWECRERGRAASSARPALARSWRPGLGRGIPLKLPVSSPAAPP